MRMLKQPGRRTDQETCGEADPGPSLSIFGLALPFPQKIREQAFSRFGQDRLRMELDAFDRSARTRRNTDSIRTQVLHFLQRYLIVAPNHQICSKLAEVLDEVIGERVVVIDYQNHRIRCARSIARKRAVALLTHS